jgi:hypothetical protein
LCRELVPAGAELVVPSGRGDGGGEPEGRDPQQEVDERHAPAAGGTGRRRRTCVDTWRLKLERRGGRWRSLAVLAGVVVDRDDVRGGAGLAGAHGCCSERVYGCMDEVWIYRGIRVEEVSVHIWAL